MKKRIISTALGAALALMSGCEGDDPDIVGPCAVTDDPYVQIAQRDGNYGGLVDGSPVTYGHPPQGGAPFAPFQVRVHGLDHQGAGYRVLLDAFDTETGEVVGQGEYPQHFVCANVGDNAGFRVAPELHMRFFGFELEDLADVEVDVVVTVDDGLGTALLTSFRGMLTHDVQ